MKDNNDGLGYVEEMLVYGTPTTDSKCPVCGSSITVNVKNQLVPRRSWHVLTCDNDQCDWSTEYELQRTWS